ncbi:hypothetical protein ITJ46_11930 [Rathayibacter sp. VKM Ac-2878]|nr:hypothetical protein [Rathayibacter sp. VKM Ac-2879]MBF4504637.1 hypothetical protein [Rathayibacter sp. VKM Ac-2878]
MQIERVTSRAQFDDFALLPGRLHPRSLAVPTPERVLHSWWRGTRSRQAPIELLLARDRNGRVVGRTTVHTDVRLDARLGARSLLFGATEFADDAVAEALFEAIVERSRGHEQLVGPVSLLPSEGGGVVTSGFGQRGFLGSAWNPASYPGIYEAAGFERLWEGDTWSVETLPREAGDPLGPVAASEWAAAGLRPSRLSPARIEATRAAMLDVLNRAGASSPYAVEVTAGELGPIGASAFLDAELLRLAHDTATGRVVGFALALPDWTRFLQRTRGRVGLFDQARAVVTRERFRQEAVLAVQCTDPAEQGRGVGGLLGRQLQARLVQRGYRRLRVPSVRRGDTAARAQLEHFGGVPLHGITFYRRALG